MVDHTQGCSGEPRPGHLLLTSSDSLCFLAFRSALHDFARYQVQSASLETSGAKNMFEDDHRPAHPAKSKTNRSRGQTAEYAEAGNLECG